MAENITLARAFGIDMPDGSRRVWPAGWSGRMGTTLARRAIEGGYTEHPAEPAGPAAAAEVSMAMSRAELDGIARARGLDPEKHRTKADLVAALNG